MKSGASDPFADDEGDDADREERATDPEHGGESPPPNLETAGSRDRTTESGADASDDGDGTGEEVMDARSLSREELPLVLRRERVKDERPEVHQLFVQEETHERAIEAERELESRLDADLARTDAREAIYLAGMANLGEATRILREWGYDL